MPFNDSTELVSEILIAEAISALESTPSLLVSNSLVIVLLKAESGKLVSLIATSPEAVLAVNPVSPDETPIEQVNNTVNKKATSFLFIVFPVLKNAKSYLSFNKSPDKHASLSELVSLISVCDVF